MTHPKPRGPYAGTAARRQAILAAARESFTERGFDKASLRDIAARAGITHAGLLHHYPDKDSLLRAVLAEQDAAEEERVRLEGLAELPSYSALLLDVIRQHQGSPDVVRFWAEITAAASRADHPAHDYLADRYRHRRARIAARPPGAPLSPDAASFLLLAVQDGLELQWLIDPMIDILGPLSDFLKLLEIE